MTDTAAPSRFADLRKVPDAPVAGILARGNAKLQTPLEAPAGAGPAEVLAELSSKGALLDMLQVLAHVLPVREAIWWACLCARDLLPKGATTPSLKAAEAWVFQPGPDTRLAAREALDSAPNDDDTVLVAMAAAFSEGTLGPGELEDYDAPPGAIGAAAYGMALTALYHDETRVAEQGKLLIARALDIARGGNGNITPVTSTKEAST